MTTPAQPTQPPDETPEDLAAGGTPPPSLYESRGSIARDAEIQITSIHDVALGTRPAVHNIGDGFLLPSNGQFFRRSGPPPRTFAELHSKRRAQKISVHGEYWMRITDSAWLRRLISYWISHNASPDDDPRKNKGGPIGREIKANAFMEALKADPAPYEEMRKRLETMPMNKGRKKDMQEALKKMALEQTGLEVPLNFEDIARAAGITQEDFRQFREDAAAFRRKTKQGKKGEGSEEESEAGASRPIAAANTVDRVLRDFAVAGTPRAQSAADEYPHVLVKPHFIETANPAGGQAFESGIFTISETGYSVEPHTLDILYPAARPCPAFPSSEKGELQEWLKKTLTGELKVMQFFQSAFPDPDLMTLALEIAGSLIYGRPSERRVFVIKGRGRSGKTTFADLIRTAIGPGCPVVRREDIAGTFDGNSLKGASCIVHSEYEIPDPNDRISVRANTQMLERIKELVGEREIRVEEKNRPSETIQSGDLQVLIHGNSHPLVGSTRENQAAWDARLVALPMETRLPDEERITNLLDMIINSPEEMAAFAAISLAHYAAAVHRGGGMGRPEVFTETEESKKLKHDILVNWVLDAADLFHVHGDIRERLSAKEIKAHLIKNLKGCPHIVPIMKSAKNPETGVAEEREAWDVSKPFYRDVTHYLRNQAIYDKPAVPHTGGGLAGVRALRPEEIAEMRGEELPEEEKIIGPPPKLLSKPYGRQKPDSYRSQDPTQAA